MRRISALVVLLMSIVLPTHQAARAEGFQIDVDFLGSTAIGEYDFDGFNVSASDFFDTGFGVLGTALIGLSDNLLVGGQAGYYSNPAGDLLELAGVALDLNTVPLHGIVRFQSAGQGIGFFGEAGAGVSFLSTSSEFGNSESESNFSFLVGAGLTYSFSESWALGTAIRYHQIQTGDFIAEDDNAQFLLASIGFRYSSN